MTLLDFEYSTKGNKIILTNYIGNDKIIDFAFPKMNFDIELKDSCFYNNKVIEEVTIPENIKVIPGNTFACCPNLKKVTLNKTKEIHENAFAMCTNLKEIILPDTIKTIKTGAFDDCDKLIFKNIENESIKIKNNNIYRKEIEDNKLIYYLIDCKQKNDTLVINENEIIINAIINKHIKTIILTKNDEIKNNFIFPKKIDNLYCSKLAEIYFTFECKNLYLNQTLEELNKNKKRNLKPYQNIIYKKSVDELLKDGYNFKQIDLIIKGYKKNILLSNSNINVDHLILKNIIDHFDYRDSDLYKIYHLLEQEQNLDTDLRIQRIIQGKLEQNYIFSTKEDMIK